MMKKRNLFMVVLAIPFIFFLTYCGNSEQKQTETKDVTTEVVQEETNEFQILSEYLKQNGDYINTAIDKGGAPQLIKADELNDLLGGYVLIIDIRSPKVFSEGHIPGAVNVNMALLINYMKDDISVDDYDKIVLVCHSGQTSAFAATVLRMMGFNTVYSLKWGMSSWNMKFAKSKWMARISDEYNDQLETTANPKAAAGDFPEISTGYTNPTEILDEQALRLFALGFGKVTAKSADVFADPSAYYIINVWPTEDYDLGHIPGAIQYDLKGSLRYDLELNTLPKDKPVLVYCFSGQKSACIVAYLRILGYDAYTLLYGANSFMHQVLIDHDWPAFTKKDVGSYDFEESEFDAAGGEEEEGAGGC